MNILRNHPNSVKMVCDCEVDILGSEPFMRMSYCGLQGRDELSQKCQFCGKSFKQTSTID
jgi:hypothetical protein